MRIKIMQFSAVSLILLLAGCSCTKNYALAVNSWQGAPKTALIHQWGKPEQNSTLANGHELYTYRTVEHESVAKTYSPITGRISPQEKNALSRPSALQNTGRYTFWCETQFEINQAGMIVNTKFTGNNCVATQHNAENWAFVR